MVNKWRLLLALGLSSAGAVLWQLLGAWVYSGSERFYLLVPPLFVGCFLLLMPGGWRALRSHCRSFAFYLLGLAVFCAGYQTVATRAILYDTNAAITPVLRPAEALIALYFLAAVTLLVIPPLSLLRWLCRALADRLFGMPSASEPAKSLTRRSTPGANATRLASSTARYCLREFAPILLLAPVLTSYFLAIVFVHRPKIGNLASAKTYVDFHYGGVFFERVCEDVHFQTEDGFVIRGWFIEALRHPSARTLIVCHGLGSNRTDFIHYHQIGDELDANILLFDFRGHGDSDGHTISMGHREKLDVLAAIDYLRSQRPDQAESVVGLGISMGSAALIGAAGEADPPLDAIIVDSGFASARELVDNIVAPFPAFLRPFLGATGFPLASLHAGCSLDDVRPVDQIDSIRCPLLVIHASGDCVAPAEHAIRLHERATADLPHYLWIADTGCHNSAYNGRRFEYSRQVARLNRHLRPTLVRHVGYELQWAPSSGRDRP